MLRVHFFTYAAIAIFASACSGTSRINRSIRPLPNEVVLTIDNQNLFDVEVRIVTDRSCSYGSGGSYVRGGRIFFVRGGEERSFRLQPGSFGFSRFALQVRLKNPAGLNRVTNGCSGDTSSPPAGSIVVFSIPGNLSYLQASIPMLRLPR